MQSLNLEPYAFYTFLIMLIITLLCVLFFLFKFFALNSALTSLLDTTYELSDNLNSAQSKMEDSSKQISKATKNLKTLMTVLPFLWLIRQTYKEDIEENGIPGYKKATNKVITQQIQKKQVKSFLQEFKKK